MKPGDSPFDPPPISSQMGEALVVRLSRLEREIHLLRRLVMVLGFGVVATFALGVLAFRATGAFSDERGVAVRQISLRDGSGLTRGRWFVDENGAATMQMNDVNGVSRLRLTVLQDGSPGVALADRNTRSRIVLGLLSGEGGSLVFADEEGNTRLVLGVGADAAGNLVFSNQYGEPRAGIGVSADGDAYWSVAGDDAPAAPRDTTNGSSQR